MGKTSDSFKRQIGRDAGKVVSNFLFGDKHATPFRRANSLEKKQSRNQRKAIELKEKQNLHSIDSAVIGAIDQVISLQIPNDENEIVNILNGFDVQLKASKWQEMNGDDEEEIKIRNKYPDAVLEKYKQCVKELEFINANENRIEFYKKKLKKHKHSRFFAKNKTIVLALGLFAIAFLILGIMSIFE
ncbi:hypothetical protein [Tenacibaculum piscium]|uniref:hypothetical protein n=1 Tax=Tenacibaculum piscium TaxID=1458515 RepID=UPI001BEADB64|nr:hypothetical protein [Tenacibaculum piscium]